MALTFPAAYHNRNVTFLAYCVYCFVVAKKCFFFFFFFFCVSVENIRKFLFDNSKQSVPICLVFGTDIDIMSVPIDKIDIFFKSILSQSSCIFSLLPPPRDLKSHL